MSHIIRMVHVMNMDTDEEYIQLTEDMDCDAEDFCRPGFKVMNDFTFLRPPKSTMLPIEHEFRKVD